MSNLVKSGRIITGDEKRVIDYNELISLKLMKFKEKTEEAEKASEDFVLLSSNEGIEKIVEVEENSNQVDLSKAYEEEERIIEEANAKAAAIIEEAIIRAEILTQEIAVKAKEDGFHEGLKKGAFETDKLKKQLMEDKTRQEDDYNRQLELLEPNLVSVILEVFSKVFNVVLEDKENMIQHLVANAVAHIDNSYEFIIRVSKEDYQILKDSKDKVFEEVPRISTLEIVKDASLKKNQCLIETDGGIFDCSIDTQLEKLMSDIKILSCI